MESTYNIFMYFLYSSEWSFVVYWKKTKSKLEIGMPFYNKQQITFQNDVINFS